MAEASMHVDHEPLSMSDEYREEHLNVSMEIAGRYSASEEAAITLVRHAEGVCLWRAETKPRLSTGGAAARVEYHVSNRQRLKSMCMPDLTDAGLNFEFESRRSQARRGALATTL